MKNIIFLLLIIIFIIIKNILGESNDSSFDLLEKNSIIVNNINETKENILDDGNIYDINTTKEFELNIKINGTLKNTLIILFYSHSCGHCQHFQPIYKNISKILKDNINVKFSKIVLSSCEQIFKKYPQINVPYIPMIYLYKNGNFIRYQGKREQEEIISFINNAHNFECNEILSLSELNKFINKKTLFSLDKKSHFILGLFKNKTKSNKEIDNISFIKNNFFELNTLNNDILLNKNCFYYVYTDNNEKNKNESYNFINNILFNENDRDNENENLIFAYNYQRGLNTFSLFNSYLKFKNNSTNINDYNNINKHIKIIQNKFKSFINDNYLYKYYYINSKNDLKNFINHNKNYFIFKYKTTKTYKLYINEINYILSLNNSLSNNYLFLLFNISTKYEKEKISFFTPHDFIPIEIVGEKDFNKTYIEYKIFEYIYRDQHNMITSQLEMSQKLIKNIYDFFAGSGDKINKTKENISDVNEENENIEEKIEKNFEFEYENELIDEINKTIIEDEKMNEEKEKKNKNENIKKNLKTMIKRRQKFRFDKEEDLGFNKNLILFPFYLIIYTILYFLVYNYICKKNENKILYSRLPSDDPKNK